MTKAQKDFCNIIEAALFSSETPLSILNMQQLFPKAMKPSREEILAAIAVLLDEYEGRGVELIQAGGGYRFQTRSVMPTGFADCASFDPRGIRTRF